MNIECGVYCLINQTIDKVLSEFKTNDFVGQLYQVKVPPINPKNSKAKTLIKCNMEYLIALVNCEHNWVLSDECLSDIELCAMIIKHRLYTDKKLFRYIKRHGISTIEGMGIHCVVTINKLFGGMYDNFGRT